ncbi:peptidylprolyl isomerase [Limoniibacter endophyticus]|uniref:Parvulin-like PPIase n=1 Tax=Limoniibacter endophyticus TaxID=1565040 RepID=A0A8J3GHP4_9HYPH|nr:peptidylprolyl isomerase [Limoniibacter endophyticus]GHC76196.1 peptidylprolyl isomerase [Limoniibacter endophyticus]
MSFILMRNRKSHIAAAFAAMLLSAAPLHAQDAAPAVDPKAVVATVDGKEITQGELALIQEELGQQFAALPEDQRQAAALVALVEVKHFASEAEKEGIDKTPEFQLRLDHLRSRALHSQYVASLEKQITDEELKAEYDAQIAKIPASEEIHARHILIRGSDNAEEDAKAKEKAEEIIGQLNDGGNFEELAKENSADGSASEGGDLGYFGKGQMVPPFEEAAFALEKGAYTKEPVKSQFGYHIIKLEDKRDRQPPAFEDVKDQVRSMMLSQKYQGIVRDLPNQAKVDIPDGTLKTAYDNMIKQSTDALNGQQAPAGGAVPAPAQ